MRHKFEMSLAVIAAVALAAALYACGGDSATGRDGDAAIAVVATTTQIGDLVRNVGGDRVSVNQVLKPGSDPHGFEPRPSDVAAAASAALLFSNGQDLDAWAERLAEDSGGSAEVIDLSADLPDLAPSQRHEDEHAEHEHGDDHAVEEHGDHEADPEEEHHHDSEFDPHWWHDPRNAIAAVNVIASRLVEADPDGASEYRRNANRFNDRLERLDGQIARCIERIPAEQRKLVTDHEAFGYFANRYGLEIIGAVIPALTTEAQPSARDLHELAEEIEHEGVTAVFPETSLSPKLAEAIAAQTGASADHALYGDTLGEPGSEGATYLGMMAANALAIADGLSGGEVDCEIDTAE